MASDFTERLQQYRDAIDEALGSEDGVELPDILGQLRTLAQHGLELIAGEQPAAGALDALHTIAMRQNLDSAVSEATAMFESPQRFREMLYFARCLERESAAAMSLLHARLYLEGAAAPSARYPDLAKDQASLLDATTFSALWREPERHAWMLEVIAIWRREYTPVYTARHAEFRASVEAVATEVDELSSHARAIEQLNGLRRLGPPLALVALGQFHELEQLFACSIDSGVLAEALIRRPACPLCSYRLGEAAPTEDARSVRSALERALSAHISRLAQRVVTRLLNRPASMREDRLDRFLQVVEAADLSGLASVLDDGLVEFLRDLLESPEPRQNLIDLLAQDYPEVTEANAHEVIERFRRLLETELSRGGGRFFIGRED